MLGVVYLIFNEGYSASAGDDWARPQLCEEAIRLGRVLAGLLPSEPEVYGLCALMELQAAIAACHARALRPEDTDWARIVALYRLLAHVAPSAVVRLNLAVAVGMASGPAAGLELLDELTAAGALTSYPYLPAARGDLLDRLGRAEEARAEFARAAALTGNARERDLFLARAATPS